MQQSSSRIRSGFLTSFVTVVVFGAVLMAAGDGIDWAEGWVAVVLMAVYALGALLVTDPRPAQRPRDPAHAAGHLELGHPAGCLVGHFGPLALLVEFTLLSVAPSRNPRRHHHRRLVRTFLGQCDPEATTRRLLAALYQHGVVATGLVNCDRGGRDLLRLWLDAGMELGSHNASQADVDKTDPDIWLDRVDRCSGALSELTGQPIRYFLYPYLYNGPMPQVRDRIPADLLKRGLAIARITIGAVNAVLAFDQFDAAGSAAGAYTAAVDATLATTFDIAGVTDAAGTTLVMQDFRVRLTG